VEDDMWKTNLAKTASKDPQEKIKKSSKKTETSLQMVIIVVMGGSLFLFTDLI
jgi:hypothetical protein